MFIRKLLTPSSIPVMLGIGLGWVIFLIGCGTSIKYAHVLTSKDQMWTIPQGTKFYATQKPKYENVTEFTADDDLAIVYKGKLLELEKEANKQAFEAKEKGTEIGIKLGGTVALFGLIVFLFIERLFSWLFRKKS